MSYQLQNTHTAKDAVMMVSSASQRLALYADYADDIDWVYDD